MKDTVGIHCRKIAERVQQAPIAESSKQALLASLSKLPNLYEKFRANYESRDGEEIARLLQNALDQLAGGEPVSETGKLGAWIVERTQQLHDQSGIPTLKLRLPRTAAPLVKNRGSR